MLKERILIRDFTEHPVLQGCMRITVGRPEENVKVLGAIKLLCRGGN
jgi:histidinol-phosphate aminotransferase